MWNLRKCPNNVAVVDDNDNTLTYAQLADIGEELSSVVNSCASSVGNRQLVFNMCSNVMGSLAGYVSFINGGFVPVMLKHDLDEDLLSKLLNDYQPEFIWTPNEDVMQDVYSCFKTVYSNLGYTLLRTSYNTKRKMHPSLGLLLTTSGSTGSPKFVRQSYDNIRANIDSIVKYLHLDAGERPITTLPMNYTYGISVINTHIDVGATILLTDKTIMQREFWNFLHARAATSISGVPYTYEMLKRLHFFRMELPSLHTMTQAGGRLSPDLQREFAQFASDTMREFVVMYGACEATARMGWLPPERSLEKPGSVGIAIPGGRFELIDANGNLLNGPGVVGELVYYGSNVTMGYATSGKDLENGDEWRGRYLTGDMAERDDEGFYYIAGRKKRFLKIYGNRVNLDDCENLLKARFSGEEIACGGIDDKLYVFGTNDDTLPIMRSYLIEKIGLNAAAFKTVKLETMPINESGKILYSELAHYYQA